MKLYKKNYIWLADDSNVAKSIGQVWQIIKSKDIDTKTKLKFIFNSDKEIKTIDKEVKLLDTRIIEKINNIEGIPQEILELKKERDLARKEKDWQRNDELRVEIEREGYILKDLPAQAGKDGETIIRKNPSSSLV